MSLRRPAAWLLACAALAGGGCGAGDRAPADASRVVRVTVAVDGLVPEVATGVATGDGRVVTVAHALAGGRAVAVAGRPARVLRADRRLDLAVLAVPGLRAPRVRLGDAARRAEVHVGVLRDGAPRTLRGAVRRRVVVRWREQPGDAPLLRGGLEVAARVEPGDSGAPVVDGRGRLLGVVYGRSEDRDGTAWAVDAAGVRAVLGR